MCRGETVDILEKDVEDSRQEEKSKTTEKVHGHEDGCWSRSGGKGWGMKEAYDPLW